MASASRPSVPGSSPNAPQDARSAAPAVPGFVLGEALGRGAMGVVYRARELSTDREVAIKWCPGATDERRRQRFQREARAAAKVRHPNIVSILSAGATPEGSFIVMELVDGFPLSAALDSRSLGLKALTSIVAKVSRGLEAVHAAGILHRDVKPSNILVDRRGEPRLADFGLARIFEQESTLTGPLVPLGTFGYMAPEILRGGGAIATQASDVFSLGCTLHEGLGGRPPFGEGVDTADRLLDGRPLPLPQETPQALASIALDAIAVDPGSRPSARELAERLEAADLSAPARRTRSSRLERARPPRARRSPARALAAAALLGCGALLGALFAPRAPRAPEVASSPPEPAPPVAAEPRATPVVSPAPVVSATPTPGTMETRRPDETPIQPNAVPVEADPAVKADPVEPRADPGSKAPEAVAPSEPQETKRSAPPAVEPPKQVERPAEPPKQVERPAEPPKPAEKPPKGKASAAELDKLLDDCQKAMAKDDRARVVALAQRGIARCPDSDKKRASRFHALLGRDRLLDLATAEAEEELARAIDLDPTNVPALFASAAACACSGDPGAEARMAKRGPALRDIQGTGPELDALKVLLDARFGNPGVDAAAAKVTTKDQVLFKTLLEFVKSKAARTRR